MLVRHVVPRKSLEHTSIMLTRIALLAVALYAAGARADNPGPPMFSFSGFGTLGVVHSSEDQADFTTNIFKPNGAGHSHRWSADVDSLIGVQGTAVLTPKLSAVLQVIAEQNYDNSYRPHIEWANFNYQFTSNFSVRIGRTVLPIFLVSDFVKVGYANPWVRPPVEVYSIAPISYSDGIDASYRVRIGKWVDILRGSYGKGEYKLTAGGAAKGEKLWGISNTAEYGPTTLRIAYHKANVTVESVNALFDAFRLYGPEGIAIADKYDAANKPYSVLALGASYDPGKWFVMGEWGYYDTRSVFGKGPTWYASSGYRIGTFTPYLTYAQVKADNLSDPGLSLSALPPSLAGSANVLNDTLNALLSTKLVQNTISIGGRWDFMSNAAVKLQYDHTRIGNGSIGRFINTQPGYQLGGTINLFSAAIQFVF